MRIDWLAKTTTKGRALGGLVVRTSSRKGVAAVPDRARRGRRKRRWAWTIASHLRGGGPLLGPARRVGGRLHVVRGGRLVLDSA
eukprot:9557712-Alexandrium_andersonii.AAC.2